MSTKRTPTVNMYWLILALVSITIPSPDTPYLLRLIAGFLAGVCVMLFAGSIQNAIDHRNEDRQ